MNNQNALSSGELDTTYIIKAVDANDEAIKDFLFSLGCYEGENITIVSRLAGQFVVSIKDGRYSIDEELAGCIFI